MPRRHFVIDRSKWHWYSGRHKWAFDSPYLESGEIDGAFLREGVDDNRPFLNSVWRLLGKITVNLGGDWCGFSAIEWTTKKPRRMLCGRHPTPDSWVFPEDCPYYQDELWDDDPPKNKKLQYWGAVPPNASTE